MIIAITGYIGTGKTTVANFFHENGFSVINVDQIGHDILKNQSIRDRILSAFGMDILDREMNIDREKLRKIVFQDETKLKTLDSLVHPLLESELKRKVSENEGNSVIDVALFDELNIKGISEKVILVKADLEYVYQRIQERFSKGDVINIMNSQKIITESDFVIQNDGSLDELKEKVRGIIEQISVA